MEMEQVGKEVKKMEKNEVEQLLAIGERVCLRVKTQMPATRIVFEKSSIEDGQLMLVMDVHGVPEKNMANIGIIKFFQREFKRRVRIAQGLSSREKVIEVIG